MKETLAFQAAGNRPGSGRLWIWQSHGALAIRAERGKSSTYLPCPHTGASRQARSKLTGLCSEAPEDVGKADALADLSTDQHAYSEQGGESMNNSIRTAAKTMAAVIAAGAMAVAPVAGTINFGAMTAMAEATVPKSTDTAAIKVSGITNGEGVVVKAYKILEAEYSDEGFKDWKKLVTYTGSTNDPYLPTADEMKTIIQNNLSNLTATALTYNTTNSDFEATVAAGTYIILVEKTAEEDVSIYNPMIVSVGYKDSVLQQGSIDAGGNFVVDGQTAYAKKTDIPLTKKITNLDGQSGNPSKSSADAAQNDRADGEDLQVGDTGKFEITTKFPAYSSAYKDVTFTLTDTQGKGLGTPTSFVVKVDGTEVAPDASKYTITTLDIDKDGGKVANDFTVTFTSNFVLQNTGKDVVVTYQAVLTDEAAQRLNPNTNKVELEYTKDIKSNTDKKQDYTYDYSFPVTILKKGEDSDAAALKGATFKLTRESKTGNDYATVNEWSKTTDDNGKITFEHLDEGTYTLKETQAPTGYSINDATYTIVITPAYGDNGKLTSYTIYATNDKDTTYSFSTTVSAEKATEDALEISDTKMAGLPSTGARSALILTIAGIAVMITVMAASRRKKIAD